MVRYADDFIACFESEEDARGNDTCCGEAVDREGCLYGCTVQDQITR
jgi:hypothetical protein